MGDRSGARRLFLTLGASALAVGLHLACTDEMGVRSPDGMGGARSSDGSGPGAAGQVGSNAAGSGQGASGPGSGGEGMPPVGPTSFSCDGLPRSASPPLRRLTKVQYENTLLDLLTMTLSAEAAADVMASLSGELDQLLPEVRVKVPEDLHGTYRRLDQTVQQTHVDAWFALGEAVGQRLAAPEYQSALLGSCSEQASSEEQGEECIRAFIERFGRLALRRPLSSEEVDLYFSFYEPSTGIDPEGVVDVVTGLLNAPQFLYVIEHGASEVEDAGDTFTLSGPELAQRLSYHFWNSMPDQELLDLADSGQLLDDEVYAGQVERLWADARTYDTIARFFREWLKLEDLPELDRNNEANVFINFAGENLPSDELRTAMIDEALALLNYYTWDRPAGLQEVFLSPYSFAQTEELAAIYGVEAWDGSGEPPRLEGRPGLLTRAAFLSTGTANTRPIMKGVFIRTNVLCDVIPPPPENANAVPPELSPDLTTRQVVEALTEGKDNVGCAACHQSFINPLGFATEGFDSLGRVRTEQTLFDDEGELLGTKPVDTQTIPQVILGDQTEVEGAEGLMEAIASSGKLEACFARQYFRFSFGRFEQVDQDGCVLEQMRQSLAQTGSLADMLREVALSDAFRSRTFSDTSNLEESP